jgi:glycosyltransferase involved in cell wall biosynthesis
MATASGMKSAAQPLPVLYVLDQMWNAGGGTESQFLTLLRNLDRRLFAPRVVLLRGEDRLSHHVPDVPVEILGIDSLKSPRFLARAFSLMRRVRAEKIRLAHIYLNDASMGLPPFLRLGGARVIVSRRDLGFWYTPQNLRVLRAIRPAVAAVVANCQAVKENVVQRERYAADRVRVIHNGFEPRGELQGRSAARRRLGLREGDPVITLVANLRPLKRVDDAIRAAGLLVREFPAIKLLLVGEDPPHDGAESHGERLRRLAAELGVAGNIVFSGLQVDPMPFIEAADACLLLSETEGLSNSLIEYLWAGRAAVATRVGGNSELVAHGERGFLVDVGDWQAVATHLRKLLTTDADSMGARAREYATQNFSTPTMVRRHARLYLDLLGANLPDQPT